METNNKVYRIDVKALKRQSNYNNPLIGDLIHRGVSQFLRIEPGLENKPSPAMIDFLEQLGIITTRDLSFEKETPLKTLHS